MTFQTNGGVSPYRSTPVLPRLRSLPFLSTGQPIEVPDIAEHPEILARPDWAKAEGIRALGGQPLVHRGKVLGVLDVFTRACLGEKT